MKSSLITLFSMILLFTSIYAQYLNNPVSPSSHVLEASTFLGGNGKDGSYYTGDDIAFDSNGNIFIAGTTLSTDFPIQTGGYCQTLTGGTDIIIAKFSPDLSTLMASTYIGGSGNEEARYLVLDDQGNIYVTGITESSDFPTTILAFDVSYNGGNTCPYGSGDAFICKIDNNLKQLKASTYFGGNGHDNCSSIELDQNGNVFISGSTSSTDFPMTTGTYDSTHQSGGNFGDDVFVSKLDSNLATLLGSTYIGGSADDFCEALVIDNDGNVFVSGWLTSNNYPTTTGCYDNTYNGYYYDAFISKFSNDLTSLSASTFLGGSSWEFIYGMCLDDSNNVYVTGHTSSLNFPTSANSYDNSYNGSGGPNFGDDVFAAKLNNDLSLLKAATYLGGSQWENGLSIQFNDNKVYISGTTSSSDFPTTANAYSQTYMGGSKYNGDVFIACLDDKLTSLFTSTYLGSNSDESAGSIIINQDEKVYVSGSTASANFPVSYSAYDTTYNGGNTDLFISLFDSLVSTGYNSTVVNNRLTTLKLYPNYPNPFNPETVISYQLSENNFVQLNVFNSLGQIVRSLVNNSQTADNYSVTWKGKDDFGNNLPSGLYFYQLKTNDKSITRKMILIR